MIDKNDPRLTAYVLGELSHTEMIEIDQAIFESPEIADVVEEIRNTVGMLGDAYAGEEKLSLSDEQKVTLTAKPKAAKSDEARRWIAVAIAASLAAIVFGGWIFQKDYQGVTRRGRLDVAQNETIDPSDSLPEVVYRMETVTRSVPLQRTRTETRTRNVPVTKMRTESREVTLDDGTTTIKEVEVPYTENVVQSYTVEVPYTENTTQNYAVPVPYTADGKQIAAADYDRYGINPDDLGAPARSAELLSGGEIPMVIPANEGLAMGGGLGGSGVVYGGGVVTEPDFEKLIELIQQTVDSDSWSEDNTGKGEVQPFPVNLGLVVQQSQEVEPEPNETFGSTGIEGRININTMSAEDLYGTFAMPVPSFHRDDLAGNANQPSAGGVEVTTSTFNGDTRTDRSTEELLDELLEQDYLEVAGTDGQRADEYRETVDRMSAALRSANDNAFDKSKEATRLRLEAEEEVSEITSSLNERTKRLAYAEARRESDDEELRQIKDRNLELKHERVWEMRQQRGDGDSDGRSAIKMRLLEAQANSGLLRAKVGTGHPDYEASNVQVRIIEAQLEELESSRSETEKSFVEAIKDEYRSRGAVPKSEADVLSRLIDGQLAELSGRTEANPFGGSASGLSVAETEELKKHFKELKVIIQKKVPKPKSWKRVKAIPNTTRLMVGDKEELNLNGMQVNAQVDGFRARVLVDYFYYNDRERQLEGNFKLRLPDDASLYYFAFGESAYEFSPEGKLAADEFLSDGTQFVSLGADDVKRARKNQWDNVKESRMVPKEKAAHAFRETVRRRVDPALVEWSGAGVFNAKVFPLAPKKLHRIVVGYDVNLKRSKDGLKFELSLPEQTGECRVEVNVLEAEGVSYSVAPEVDPIPTELEGKLQKRFVFENDKQQLSKIELSIKGANESVLRSSNEEGDFWTLQATPDLPAEDAKANSRAIFMVDTSLSTSPDKFNVWLNLLKSTLNNNRDSLKEFDVLFFNVDSHFWKNKYVANTPENVAELKTKLESLALEGATDLYGAVEAVAEAEWTGDKTNRPDLFLLSDGAATWGETDLRLIDHLLQKPKLGSLFAYQTGLSGTAISGLRFLAGQSGGAVFSVATEDEIKTASTAHRKRPWQLKSITAAGASDILTAGRVQWVYPGQTITVVGRGDVEDSIELQFQQGNESKAVSLKPTKIQSQLASRMYGHVAVGQLESLGSQVFDVSAAYARHFRITGKTCSLLMLESEEDYQRFDIKPQEDLFVVKAKATSALVAETLEKFAEQLVDPKAKLQAWLSRLESMPGMEFKMPTALKLAMDDIKVEAISQPMESSLTTKDGLSESYLRTIAEENLDYEQIAAEASRRAGSVDDAIKVYSSLVERSPGDIVVARDVAFTALEMDRPAQAFHLLRRVARARPFQGNIYPAIGQCLAQMGKADMAIVYYEIAMNGTFQRQGGEFKQIVAAEYIHLLRQIVNGKLESSVKDFAAARLETLGKHLPFGTADVVVTMMWNQDQTDVDMHVIEPSGEECSYEHTKTRSGGQITTDIRTGFGPEMYFNANAPRGKYQLKAKFFGSGQNRTSTRNKVYMTIIRGFGTDGETMTRRTIQLDKVGEKVPVMDFGIDP